MTGETTAGRRETVGDPHCLDCPACGEPGLNDLWDGALNGMYDGDTNEVQCSYCGRMIPIVLHVSAEVRATWTRRHTCESCEGEATKICHGPNVEPWKLCDECMASHQPECEDLKQGRALIEELSE